MPTETNRGEFRCRDFREATASVFLTARISADPDYILVSSYTFRCLCLLGETTKRSCDQLNWAPVLSQSRNALSRMHWWRGGQLWPLFTWGKQHRFQATSDGCPFLPTMAECNGSGYTLSHLHASLTPWASLHKSPQNDQKPMGPRPWKHDLLESRGKLRPVGLSTSHYWRDCWFNPHSPMLSYGGWWWRTV